MHYDMDYRRAVAAAYDECGSSIEVAEQFGCSASWVRRLIQQRRQRGTLEPLSSARHDDQRCYDDADEEKIRTFIAAQPDATLQEVADALSKPAHHCTVSRTLSRLGLHRKKSPPMPPSRTGPTSRRHARTGSSSLPR
jgi:transposase